MRRVVPFALLLLVGLGSATGAVLGQELGDRSRERQAIAAEKVAVADYRSEVRPLLRDLFLAIYVVNDLEGVENVTRRDALLTTPEVRQLPQLTKRVAAVPYPRSLSEQGNRLHRQLKDLDAAVARIATGAQRSEFRKVAPELRGGYATFTQVVGFLEASSDSFLGDGATDLFEQDRVPSVAEYVVEADYACIDGNNELYELFGSAGLTAEAVRRHGDEMRSAIDATIDELVDLAAPTSMEARHRALVTALEDARKLGQGAAELHRAAQRKDASAAFRASTTFERGFARFGALSRDYDALHITWCASYFNTDPRAADPTS